jgi:aspartate carbamoyltransferase
MNGSQAAEEHHEAVHVDMVDQLTSDKKTWDGTSLLSVTQISPSGLNLLCSVASEMRELVAREGGDERLKHKLMASVFYEASTRTSCSFQAAMMRLGGRVLHVDGGASGNSSAAKKGETLSDTIRCLQCYTDVTVLRHFSRGSVRQVHDESKAAAQRDHSHQPILNAGDGVGEHPTQALLDLFTIRDELSSFLSDDKSSTEPLVVVLLGDLKHGRTVHSLAKLLARSRGEKDTRGIVLRYCAPGTLEMPANVQEYVATYSGIVQENFTTLTDAMKGAHVLYVTRIQKE